MPEKDTHIPPCTAVAQDEAQQDSDQRLEKEIHNVYVHKFHLVLTSRYQGRRFETPEFERFRKVRVLELSQRQQQQVVEQRLSLPSERDSRERFLDQIETNSALNAMGKNPLLLNLVNIMPTVLSIYPETTLQLIQLFRVCRHLISESDSVPGRSERAGLGSGEGL